MKLQLQTTSKKTSNILDDMLHRFSNSVSFVTEKKDKNIKYNYCFFGNSIALNDVLKFYKKTGLKLRYTIEYCPIYEWYDFKQINHIFKTKTNKKT